MAGRMKYVKRAFQPIAAVQLALDTDGFTYRKWGGIQRCKAGDWVVDNGGDVYTVDRESFERTYRQAGTGTFVKTTPIWAEVAREDGSVRTKEGVTHYRAGDYLVFNEEQGGDPYAMSGDNFAAMYEPTD